MPSMCSRAGFEVAVLERRVERLRLWTCVRQQPVDEVLNWPSTHNMSRPKLRMTTLCSGLIAEQRLRQRADKALLLSLPRLKGEDRLAVLAEKPDQTVLKRPALGGVEDRQRTPAPGWEAQRPG